MLTWFWWLCRQLLISMNTLKRCLLQICKYANHWITKTNALENWWNDMIIKIIKFNWFEIIVQVQEPNGQLFHHARLNVNIYLLLVSVVCLSKWRNRDKKKSVKHNRSTRSKLTANNIIIYISNYGILFT